jgi:hypothetical protein
MSRFPDTPRPTAPYPWRENRPFVAGGSEWVMQARALTRFGLLECDLMYRGKSWSELQVLSAFFNSVNGAAGRFTFVDFNGVGTIGGTDPGVPWKDLFVRQGTGSGNGPWDLPTYSIKQQMTTVAGTVTAGAGVVVTPASMSGISLGCSLTAVNADGTNGEEVTVTALSATTFTATFVSNKAANWLVNAPLVYENGVAKTTLWNTTSPGAGNYGIKLGTGTDGIDSLYAGTSTPSGVIVTISAMCRRVARRARFVAAKRAYAYNVPSNLSVESFTIAEVTK